MRQAYHKETWTMAIQTHQEANAASNHGHWSLPVWNCMTVVIKKRPVSATITREPTVTPDPELALITEPCTAAERVNTTPQENLHWASRESRLVGVRQGRTKKFVTTPFVSTDLERAMQGGQDTLMISVSRPRQKEASTFLIWIPSAKYKCPVNSLGYRDKYPIKFRTKAVLELT